MTGSDWLMKVHECELLAAEAKKKRESTWCADRTREGVGGDGRAGRDDFVAFLYETCHILCASKSTLNTVIHHTSETP